MEISKEAFQKPRTPIDLQQYVDDAYEFIREHTEMVHAARLKKEPYKTFVEELLPFSAFCTWNYGNRTDVLCSLVPGTPGRDAVVHDLTTDVEHSVEITWPIDGKQIVLEGKQLNESRVREAKVWADDDTTELEKAMKRILDKAHDKSQKDYRFEGGSTLIFVFAEDPLFSRSNQKDVAILNDLIKQIREIDFRVDDVLLMLTQGRGKPKTFIIIKNND
ncbi:MAG: hypothetical protein AABZ25_00465 [Nitrospirota bacterium]